MEYSELKKRHFGNNDADKKITDEEIIKALEYCLADRIECDKCVLQRECESNPFYSAIAKYALDLIKRQKAEIKRLKECPKRVFEYDGEVIEYCVQGPCPNFKPVYVGVDLAIKPIKNEAYKEFAERLKENIITKFGWNEYVEVEDVDNLLKEMVGKEE